jgi:hypothetical protein
LLFTNLPERLRGDLRAALAEPAPEFEDSLPPPPASGAPAPLATATRAAAVAQPDEEAQEQLVLRELQAELARLEPLPAWSVLGISQGDDLDCARNAFFAASKRYHPHLYARYARPEIKDTVTRLFIVYKQAFSQMTRSARGLRTATTMFRPGRASPENK